MSARPGIYLTLFCTVAFCCRCVCALTIEPAHDVILRHRASMPPESQGHIRYLTLSHVNDDDLGDWHNALLFSVASASRAVSLENQLPRRLDGTHVYWIDLRELRWDVGDWNKVMERYPYARDEAGNRLLVVRGDWLVKELADTRDSQAMYLLLYGEKNIPKTDTDFLKFWGVNEKQQQNGVTIGWTETQSQVNKQGTRFVERFITASADPLKGLSFGRSLWRTKDSFFVRDGTDPLETLDGTFLHQGREAIVQFPKLGRSNGKLVYGAAQAYLLAGGNADAAGKPVAAEGTVVQEAPVRLVEDFNKTLNQSAIINHASCVVCHEAGMKLPTENGLENLLRVGIELRVYGRDKREQVEAFHLTDAGKQLTRDNEDYAAFVESCNGLSTIDNARNYKRSLDLYIAPVTLEAAARELHCQSEDLRLALGYASANRIVIGNRLAGLAHNRPIPRQQWEGDYRAVQAMVQVWRNGKADTMASAVAAVRGPAAQPAPSKDNLIEGRLVVRFPAGSQLWIDGKHREGTGPVRSYYMRAAPGWSREMNVRAVMVVDGRKWAVDKKVECRAGETVEVTLTFENARPLES
jgi:uncharacterized protein (TIGR03000 family)